MGFGCLGLIGGYNDPVSEENGISIINHAFSKGITFFDTADVYGANANEVLVGKVQMTSLQFAPYLDSTWLMTKKERKIVLGLFSDLVYLKSFHHLLMFS